MNPTAMAQLAHNAVLQQLNTSPKPGLVTPDSTGAHTDMDYRVMLAAAQALAPHWVTFGQTGLFVAQQTDEQVSAIVQKVGEAALEDMYAATDGVNALKGTVLAVGLFIAAFYRLWRRNEARTADNIATQIAALAASIRRKQDTHGDWVSQSYQIEGALGEAQKGYRFWLVEGLNMYRSLSEPDKDARFFLWVSAHLDDSCLYYRAGAELAQNAKAIADYVYRNYTPQNVQGMQQYFERCHLSSGGAGDMMTLVLLADKVLPQQ